MAFKKHYNLFLDDVRFPMECTFYNTEYMPRDKSMYTQEPWVIARDYEEFTRIVLERLSYGEFPAKVSFDHDLADVHYDPSTWTESFVYKEKTGNDCAKWFVELCIEKDIRLPIGYVHSMNPIGAKRIHQTLGDYARYMRKFSPDTE